jgi:hypothetical protein
MTFVKLPLSSATYKNVNGESLTVEGSQLQDGYVTEKGGSKRRHGSTSFKDLGTGFPVTGMFYWQDKDLLFAVSNKSVYKLEEDGTTTNLSGDKLTGMNPPNFVVVRGKLFVTDGGKPIYTDGTTNMAFLTDADAVTESTHVAVLDNYLLTNEVSTGSVLFSDPLDPLTQSASDFFSPDAVSDTLQAIAATNREVLLLGSESLEFYRNDGVTPFSANPNRLIGKGTIAKNTFILVQDEIPFWLDSDRRVVKVENGVLKVVSTPYDQEIREMTTVKDAFAYDMRVDGRGFYVLNFPSEDRTLVYDYFMDQWYEWGLWNSASGSYARYIGSSYAYAKKWNKHLIGSKDDGNILELDKDTYKDNSVDIQWRKKTGHIDHGTSQKKNSKELLIRVKSGEGDSSDSAENPEILVRWKNDNNNHWSNFRSIKLKKIGNTEFIARLHQLGQYRSRQWDFVFTENVDLEIVTVEEDVEILPR